VTFYSKSLAVPARRDMDSAAVQGKALVWFNENGLCWLAIRLPT